ncbi:MAG TPA: hypothetical protein VEL52_02965 [Candidatus Bathyarchaeia archaeon]|nr:hypothetical protein [Candidatus Bathyarchaeia archaeon]
MKIAFVLGMMLIFVPIDIILEIGGDIGVLVHTALVIGLLIWLRERIKQAEKFPCMTHSVG